MKRSLAMLWLLVITGSSEVASVDSPACGANAHGERCAATAQSQSSSGTTMLQKDQPTFNDAAVALTELDEEAHVGGADSANSPVTLDVASGTAFLQFLEKKVNEAVGAHGKVVVGLLENKNPCVERTYLHETFVHSDLESASFVCHPCHASCTGDCYGAELHECHVLDLESEDAQGGAGASFVQAFQDGLRKRMEAMDLTALGNTSAEPLDHKDLMEIMEKSHGTYEVSELHEQDGDVDYKSARSEIFKVVQHGEVAETPIDSDPKLIMFEAAIAKALLDNGFLPGMTEPPTDEGLKAYSEQNVDETGVHWEEDQNSEPESGGEKTEEKGEDNQETKESLLQESSNSRGRGMVKSIAKTKLKGMAKDYSKKAAHYVKNEIKAWVAAQEGDCLDSVALVVEASQNLYECFKSNYNVLKSAFCDPPPRHKQIKDAMDGIYLASKNINFVAKILQYVPQLKNVAKLVIRVTDKVNSRMKTVTKKLDDQNKQDKGKSANGDCCPPFPATGCSGHPGASYKCGACSSGVICHVQKACNTLVKLEVKLDKFKEDFVDPLVEKVAEAAQNVQAGMNLVSGDSILHACGLKNCADLKKAAGQVKKEMDATFHDKVCPLRLPGISVPSLGPINIVADIFGKIGGWLQSLRDILAKVHCVSYPKVHVWSDYECIQICLPCCSYHGRRRWWGSVSCRSCCHNVCAWIPKVRTWNERYCFSAQDVLDFITGLLSIIFSPIMSVINLALKPIMDLIMTPVNALFDQLFGSLIIDFPAFPNMPFLDFNLPTLPSFKLSLPSYTGLDLNFPRVSFNHPTCKWIRSKLQAQSLQNLGGSGCTPASPCYACQGDCDRDTDCAGALKCKQRNSHEQVPGCAAGGVGDVTAYDYCFQE